LWDRAGSGQGDSGAGPAPMGWLHRATDAPPRYPTGSTREQRASIVERALLSNLETWQVKRRLKEEMLRHGTTVEPRGTAQVSALLEATGLDIRLKNLIYKAHRTALLSPPAPPEGLSAAKCHTADRLEFVERAKLKWEKRIRQELDAMAAELGVPLQRVRKEEPPKHVPEDHAIRFVYDDNDLLDVLCNISNPNHAATAAKTPQWGLIKVELQTLDLEQLREELREMEPGVLHLGVGDDSSQQLVEERSKAFKSALEVGYIPLLRQLTRRGVPQAMRPQVYMKIMGVEVTDASVAYLEQLNASLKEYELVTDELFRLDVTITGNDDDYFVFEEMLSDTMSTLSRDPWLSHSCAVLSQANDKPYPDAYSRQAVVFPPCGIVPFRGIVMYATPFCYLFSDPADVYFTFRSVYANYCCRLHTVSSGTGDILQLSRQFEVVLQETNPALYFHLLEKGLPPLRIAFNWIVFGFAGYLEVDQILALWDRILAWDSLLLLPVLAAAILSFREERLLKCNTPEEMRHVLADASKLKVVLLLQLYLFPEIVPG